MTDSAFFRILEVDSERSEIRARVALDPGHDVFKGHFPGQPVLPGVLQLRIVREIVNSTLQRNLRLESARSIKYLAVIDPNVHPEIDVVIRYEVLPDGMVRVSATGSRGEITFFKINAGFEQGC